MRGPSAIEKQPEPYTGLPEKPGGGQKPQGQGGSHVAVSGNTFAHKDAIKKMGGKWDGDAKAWRVPAGKAHELHGLPGLLFDGGKPPAAEKPAAEKPAAEKPAAEKPAAEKPAAGKTAVSDFVTHTSYHPATGLSKKGHNEYSFVSKDGRWHARQGNYGNMILTDRHSGEVHTVKGKMPEVAAYINGLPQGGGTPPKAGFGGSRDGGAGGDGGSIYFDGVPTPRGRAMAALLAAGLPEAAAQAFLATAKPA
jgi:hypothetical protein